MLKVLALFFLLFSLSFSMDPVKVFFPTYTLKERDFKKVVEAIKVSLEKEGIKVIRVLTLSEALKNRGVDFPDYYIVFGCETPNMGKILLKAPALSNLLPCSMAVYRDKDGSVKVATVNGIPFLAKYAHRLTPQERQEIINTYRSMRKVLNSLSVKPVKPMRVPPPKDDFVYEELVKGADYEEFRTLFESSLNGVNMNVLGAMKVSNDPPFDIFLACNLSYGEKILRDFPQFGTLAPCRIYTYKTAEGVKVGYINIPFLLKTYQKHLGPEAKEIFKKADEDIKSAIKEAGGL